MKVKLTNGTVKLYETREVEIEKLSPEEANKYFEAFIETLYEAVGEDSWTDVLKYIKEFADEACENYNV